METITFYSYKGGVGRTLMVANVARFLARFGLKVFLIDFDLEAPGLHYKFKDDIKGGIESIKSGLVDYIHAFALEDKVEPEYKDSVLEIETDQESEGSIRLWPAGAVPTRDYWRKLARINWHDLFYVQGAQGIPFFLEMQARIEEDFQPDFLLIDSRTGITEIGGVTTTILADKVICLLLDNPENREGARAVMRGIQAEPRIEGQKPVEIMPVVTRVPENTGVNEVNRILDEIKFFLNEPAENLEHTLSIKELFIVHSENKLMNKEDIRFGGDIKYDDSPVLRDYLLLFRKIIDEEILKSNLPKVIKSIKNSFLDHPVVHQKAIENIALALPLPEIVEELFNIYKIKNLHSEKFLVKAYELFRVGLSEDEPILWQIISKHYHPLLSAKTKINCPASFLEKVWRAAGHMERNFGEQLANIYRIQGDNERSKALTNELIT